MSSKDSAPADLESIASSVEDHLASLLEAHLPAEDDARLGEAMRYALLGGGKRIRPYLLLASAALFGCSNREAMNAAAALEMVHSYSLVHDDLPAMDDDTLRRGRPTVHVAFGEATAILVGDSLLTLAFGVLADPATHPDPDVRMALVAGLAKAAGAAGMAGGQALDLALEGREVPADEIAGMHSMKTGALFGFACQAGAIIGKATQAQLSALARYAAAFGQAFQLADDLLDVEGDPDAAGKALAKDAARGKATIVSALGAEAARQRLAALVGEMEQALAPFGASADTLMRLAGFVAARDK